MTASAELLLFTLIIIIYYYYCFLKHCLLKNKLKFRVSNILSKTFAGFFMYARSPSAGFYAFFFTGIQKKTKKKKGGAHVIMVQNCEESGILGKTVK